MLAEILVFAMIHRVRGFDRSTPPVECTCPTTNAKPQVGRLTFGGFEREAKANSRHLKMRGRVHHQDIARVPPNSLVVGKKEAMRRGPHFLCTSADIFRANLPSVLCTAIAVGGHSL
jgi:hypothetical protein